MSNEELILETVMGKLNSNNDLKKLIYYNDSDPLNKPNPPSLIYDKILPLPRLVTAEDEESTRLFCYVVDSGTIRKNAESYYQDINIIVDVVLHQNLITFNGGIRPYRLKKIIMNEINRNFIKETSLISNLRFQTSQQKPINSKFLSLCLVYKGTVRLD